jgi:hypothetical protein
MSAYLRVLAAGFAIGLLLVAIQGLGPCGSRTDALADTISLVSDPTPGPAARHGLKKAKEALRAKGLTVEEAATVEAARGSIVIVTGLCKGPGPAAGLLKSLTITPPEGAESLLIQHVRWDGKKGLLVSGGDDRGLMYALLDVVDRIGWGEATNPLSELRDVREKPAAAERALSVYTMQQADFERRLFNEDYWDRYFDLLARNRFSSFVLIFGYENAGYLAPPYPYFFDVEGFPDVRTIGLSREQQQRNLKALNRLIDMAHEHGLRFTAGIWDHIYRGGVQSGGVQGAEPGKPRSGTVAGLTEKNLMAYSRVALAKFLKEVPSLDAVQFRMHDESGLKPGAEMRAFWSDLFKVIKESGRNLRFDLRAKGLPDDIIDLAAESGITFRITTKYWAEQMGLPFHPTHINRQNQFDRRHGYADLLRYPQRYKMHWRLWNGGTARVLLWGDPEYVRRFAESTHLYDGDGFEVNEPLATKMASHPHDQKPFELLRPECRYYDHEFERYWHLFQVFGRLGYNPETPPEVWRREFERRFGKEAAPFVERGLHRASQVLPRVITAIFPYNRFPTTRGWVEKQRWEDLPAYARAEPSDTQQFLSMDEAARLLLEGGESAKVHPERTSEWFARTAADVREAVAQAEKLVGQQRNKEFVSTTTDLKILANLALYHSRRIHAGLGYALFKRSRALNALDDAIRHEKHAIEAWEKLVEAAGDVYNEDLMMGLPSAGLSGHWKDELAALKKGLAALENERKTFRPAAAETGPSLAHVPVRRAAPGKDVLVRATVGSPDEKPVVRVAYRTGGREWHFTQAEQAEPSLYRALIPASDVAEGLNYYIETTDSAGRKAAYPRGGESQSLAVTVTTDDTPPEVTHTPVTTAEAGKPLTFTARVRDPSGVRWARVLYRSVNQHKDYQTLAMKPTGVENEYQAVIPGEHVAAGWDFMYLIEVMDKTGNGKIYPDLEKETPYVVVRLRQP